MGWMPIFFTTIRAERCEQPAPSANLCLSSIYKKAILVWADPKALFRVSRGANANLLSGAAIEVWGTRVRLRISSTIKEHDDHPVPESCPDVSPFVWGESLITARGQLSKYTSPLYKREDGYCQTEVISLKAWSIFLSTARLLWFQPFNEGELGEGDT